MAVRQDLGLDGDALFVAHFESLPGAAFIWRRDDGDFRVVAHNRAARHFGDERAAEVIGISAREMAEFDPDFPEYLHRASETGEIQEKESDVRFGTGVVRRILATFVPLAPNLVVVHGRDVTDERAIERRLAESEARFRALVDAIPDAIMRMDADARFLDVHFPKQTRSVPWQPDDLIGKTVADFYGPQAHAAQARYNREAIRTGETQVFEVRIPGSEEMIHLESRVVRIGDDEVLVTSRDVSERAEIEGRQIIREQQELARLSGEIHDGFAQILIGANLRLASIRRTLEEEGSSHAADLGACTELIQLAVGQAREIARGLSPVPDGTGLFDALKLAARHAEQAFRVHCDFVGKGRDGGISRLAVMHLYRISQEAVTNAVRHGDATEIEIRCAVDEETMRLSIEDNGRGLPASAVETGGLGLRHMRYRANALGGDLIVDGSGRGGGARVRCICPLPAIREPDWPTAAS